MVAVSGAQDLVLKIAKLSFNSRLNVRTCSHIRVYYRTTVLSVCPGAFRRWRALLCRQLRGSSTNSAGRRALWEQMRRDTAVQLQNLTLDNNNNNRKCSSGCGSGTGSGSGSSAASSSSRVNVAPVTRGTTTAQHTLRQLIPTTTAKWWSEEFQKTVPKFRTSERHCSQKAAGRFANTVLVLLPPPRSVGAWCYNMSSGAIGLLTSSFFFYDLGSVTRYRFFQISVFRVWGLATHGV